MKPLELISRRRERRRELARQRQLEASYQRFNRLYRIQRKRMDDATGIPAYMMGTPRADRTENTSTPFPLTATEIDIKERSRNK